MVRDKSVFALCWGVSKLDKVWNFFFFFLYCSVFFFKQKTAYEIYQCDWSSDVCSSDLIAPDLAPHEGLKFPLDI